MFDRDEFSLRFGRRLRHLRRLRGFTHISLAHAADCTPQTVYNLESGRTFPSLPVAIALALALDVSPRDFIFGEEDLPNA